MDKNQPGENFVPCSLTQEFPCWFLMRMCQLFAADAVATDAAAAIAVQLMQPVHQGNRQEQTLDKV